MPISGCPFTAGGGGIYRPYLPVKIINPDTGRWYKTQGLIDTGADECSAPAPIATLLGHNLTAGLPKSIGTGGGESIAYSHTTTIEIFHPASGEHLYTVENTPIDYMPTLPVVLLGVRSFLSGFILTVNYPEQSFSITYP